MSLPEALPVMPLHDAVAFPETLMPLAVDVVQTSVAGLSARDVNVLLQSLRAIRDNIDPGSTGLLALDENGDLS